MKIKSEQLNNISNKYEDAVIISLFEEFVIEYNFISLDDIKYIYTESNDWGCFTYVEKYLIINYLLNNYELFEKMPKWLDYVLRYEANLELKIKYIEESKGDDNFDVKEIASKIEAVEFDEIV
jgi:hypothetical protein